MRPQTYSYLPSCKASPPVGWYQIIFIGSRSTCVLTTCPWLHSTVGQQLGFEPETYWSQVQHPTTTPLSHTFFFSGLHYYECVAPLVANSLQNGRFWARSTASVHDSRWESRSFCTVFIQVIRGRPCHTLAGVKIGLFLAEVKIRFADACSMFVQRCSIANCWRCSLWAWSIKRPTSRWLCHVAFYHS